MRRRPWILLGRSSAVRLGACANLVAVYFGVILDVDTSGVYLDVMAFRPDRLREAREAMTERGRKLTQDGFADLVGVSKRSPGRWENGEAEPRMAQLVRISEITGLPVGFFFGEALDTTDPIEQARHEIAEAVEKISDGFSELADVVEVLNDQARAHVPARAAA